MSGHALRRGRAHTPINIDFDDEKAWLTYDGKVLISTLPDARHSQLVPVQEEMSK
jgi:hypothetical protein